MPWMIGGGVLLVLVLAGIVMAMRGRKKPVAGADVYRQLMNTGPNTPVVDNDPKLLPLRQNLRVKFLYQEDKIDAAIELERERNPTGSMETLIKAAIERWERENR